jgi:hypothetical protein
MAHDARAGIDGVDPGQEPMKLGGPHPTEL